LVDPDRNPALSAES